MDEVVQVIMIGFGEEVGACVFDGRFDEDFGDGEVFEEPVVFAHDVPVE